MSWHLGHRQQEWQHKKCSDCQNIKWKRDGLSDIQKEELRFGS